MRHDETTSHTRQRQRISIGVERVLYQAATDRTFRNVLLCDRDEALRLGGIELTEAESRMLAAVPDAALEVMIDAVRPASPKRRRFMTAVAAASAAAVGVLEIRCSEPAATGIRPDDDGGTDAEVVPDAQTTTDASPQ